MAVLAFNVFILMSVSLSVTCRISRVSLSSLIYESCSHPVAAMILVIYVDNNGIRYNCEELVQEFEKFVKMDGWVRIKMQLEGELDWLLSVRYSYCKLTGAISCS